VQAYTIVKGDLRGCRASDPPGPAKAAGLRVETVHEVRVGIELCEPFAKCEDFYRNWHGLPIVLVVRAHK